MTGILTNPYPNRFGESLVWFGDCVFGVPSSHAQDRPFLTKYLGDPVPWHSARNNDAPPPFFFWTLFFVAQTQMMAGSAGPLSNPPAAARLLTLMVVTAVALVSTVALPTRSRVAVVADIFVPGASSLLSFASPPTHSCLSASSRHCWRYSIEGGRGPPLVGANTSPTQRRALVQKEEEEEEHRRSIEWG